MLTAKSLVNHDLKVVYLEDDLYSTLDLFRRTSLDVLPVVDEHSGDYAGMLSREAIMKALEATRFNKTAAAKLLGITFRSLRYRLDRLGID